MKAIHAAMTILMLAAAAAQAQEATSEAPRASAGAMRAAEHLAATTCTSCHGTDGRSTAPTFPNLAAQTAPYLETQLKAFRDQTRADPDAQAYMWGMASQLSDEMIVAISAHYAAQTPAAGHAGDPKLIARGEVVYKEGVPGKGIAACATCHGDHAQGNGPFPRLAGQHSGYLIKQMLVIQNVLRQAPVMHGVIKDLTREQMQSVAEYLASLGPAAK